MVRFRNPVDGATSWNDTVKGPIAFDNGELDDLIIARSDGTPTYNFCVVVDDWDMRITHVLRGDDHVNNTPRQINILRALGAPVPEYGHLPMIHGPDGHKLSKRHGAVSVMQYDEDGYLPEAVVNYLARLGWSHGDEEIFSREQFVAWFDGAHVSRSPSRFDFDKLRWLNHHYLKASDDADLAARVLPRLAASGVVPAPGGAELASVCGLLKERAQTLNELAELAHMFYIEPAISDEDRAKHLDTAPPALAPALGRVRRRIGRRRVDPGGDCRGAQGGAGRARAEDAAAGDSAAADGVRHGADAVGRRGAGGDAARDGAGAAASLRTSA